MKTETLFTNLHMCYNGREELAKVGLRTMTADESECTKFQVLVQPQKQGLLTLQLQLKMT